MRILALVAIVLVGGVGFFFGVQSNQGAVRDAERFALEVSSLEAEIERLKQRIVMQARDLQMEKSASESVRQDIVDYRLQIQALQRNLSLYKRLMNPKELRGLSSSAPVVVYNVETAMYNMTFDVMNRSARPKEIEVEVALALLASDDENREPQQFALSELVSETENFENTLQFTYFTTVSFDFALPEQVQPVSIEMLLTSGKKSVFEFSYNWNDIYREFGD